MKLLLLILAITCHHIVSAQVGGYSLVTPEEFHDNPNIKDLLLWGIQEWTQEEIDAGNLPEATYEYDVIHSIYSQVVSGMNYRFDADVKNDQGWLVRATFVVYNQPWTSTTELSSYVIEVTERPTDVETEGEVEVNAEGELNLETEVEELSDDEGLAGGYSPIDPSELETDKQLSDALNYGIQAITDEAVLNHRLPESEYKLLEVHSIAGQVVSGMNYLFDVSLQNCAGLVARTVFTVYSQVWTETLEATSESLDITDTPEEGLIGGDCTADDDEVDDSSESITVEEATVETEEEVLETGEDDIAGAYTLLDPEEAANDPEVQELQNFGADYVIEEGIKDGRLPDSTYEVSNVYSVERQVVSGINYRFDVELRSCRGLTARAQYVVYEQEWSGTREVDSYHFDITAAPNGPTLEGCPEEVL